MQSTQTLLTATGGSSVTDCRSPTKRFRAGAVALHPSTRVVSPRLCAPEVTSGFVGFVSWAVGVKATGALSSVHV